MRRGGCGILIGPRRHDGVLELVELALIAEGLALPGLAEDGEALLEARLALAVGNAEHVVGARRAAAPHAHLEAALAELVEGGRFLGDAQGIAEREHLHGGADVDAPGPAGHGGGHHHGGGDDGAAPG